MDVDMFRLNLSHTPVEKIGELVGLIRAHSNTPICLDTQGAQARTGRFSKDTASLQHGGEVKLVATPREGDETVVPIYPPRILDQLALDDLISIDFGIALLQVTQISPQHLARVISGGTVGSNKAISILDRTVDLDPLTESDYVAIKIGMNVGVEHVALSFTNHPEDIALLRGLVNEKTEIIAKIESRRGLENLTPILEAADAILIDRGDLSREVPIENLPFVQKEIIRRSNESGVPVYVATNLLESMVSEPRPTRAEVNDVINTLIDGADGLVLAAETAIGNYPVQCVDMVQTLVHRYETRKQNPGLESSLVSVSRLISPHGGTLVNRLATGWPEQALRSLPRLEIGDNTMIDVRQIAIGVFSPIEGFMGREVLESVLDSSRLPDGTVWPMPVLLQLPAGSNLDLPAGETIALEHGGEIKGLLTLEESFTFDLKKLANGWYGTQDQSHPGVASLMQGGDRFVAGKVDLLPENSSLRNAYDLTPSQIRQIFDFQGWRRVIGFHTRNVAHRAHEYIQLTSLADYYADGLFIHPVVGPKKSGDFSADIILKTYQLLISQFYPANKTVLSGFAAYSRYAGPKEAVFTALSRQNFGCSHFIVGRDHTGVGDFYSPDAAQRLFEELGDMAIQPIFFNEVYYCHQCGDHVQTCVHGQAPENKISGSQARRSLVNGETLPNWYMREPLSQLIIEEMRKGNEVFTP